MKFAQLVNRAAVFGDTLKWCVANPGKPRPTEFSSPLSGGQFLMVLKRRGS